MAMHALVGPNDQIIEYRGEAPIGDQVNMKARGKPRQIPVMIEDVQFNPASEVREGPTYVVQATQVIERYTKRAKTPAEVAAMRAEKLQQLHDEADQQLGSAVSISRQIMGLARLVELLFLHTDVTAWPAAQRTQIATILTKMASIRTTRSTEDAKEAELAALATPAQIAAYDVTQGWV